MDSFKMPKNAENFYCKKCDFKCSKQSNWNTHLATPKHVKSYIGVTFDTNLMPENAKVFKCVCGHTYKFRQGLYKHKQKCNIIQSESESLITTNATPPSNVDVEKITELFKHMLTQNQDFMTDMMEKVIPNIGNTTNTNSHNTTNNQFNIQMFLNEHCKNAMNLTDFVQSLPITSATFDSTIENGLTKTITNMMLNGLSKLDILERPIHCTDASRKTLYVKEADVWEKDNELLHVINSIIYLSVKQRTMLNVWIDANEGWRKNDRLQNKMTYLLMNTMELIERDDKEKSKIIRSISKNVYLDSETKKLYM